MNTKDAIQTFITAKTLPNSVTNTKVGQLMTETLMYSRSTGLGLQIKSKGFNANDIPNQLFDIEPGDIVYGWLDVNNYLPESMYLGVDPEDLTNRDNYSQGIVTDYTTVRELVIYP